MRFAADVGGTFTDLMIESGDGAWTMYKAPTTPGDPVQGLFDAFDLAALERGCTLHDLLSMGDTLLHGTTHALNALVTGGTARTAFLTTEGHPDVLLLREGGRSEPFNHTQPYPKPYVPRSLTFEIQERITSNGAVLRPLDEPSAIQTIAALKESAVEAVAVCLLWSVVNPAHELRIGELLEQRLPGVPYTLSHRLNPALREYRRASSASIDASLKPLMTNYLRGLTQRLQAAGFAGRLLILTSQGGALDVDDVIAAPIHLMNSGPSMAPVAGREFGSRDCQARDLIVADAGGTTYDVSLVRDGRIPLTRETWIGRPFLGHMTGFPSVDVKSIGAGGGSVAWVDGGGALHFGPRSMGARPGPACYAQGGDEATLTDACVVLGYLDPESFLGGRMRLDRDAAFRAIGARVAEPLGVRIESAAWAILAVATENMAQAILEITVNQGIDPKTAVLIGGGGAAGLNSVWIARRLGCGQVLIPSAGAALSAVGALISDLRREFRICAFQSTDRFDSASANRTLAALRNQCEAFLRDGADGSDNWIEYAVEARYRNQVWEIHLPLNAAQFASEADIHAMIEDFHAEHHRIYSVRDEASPVEIVNWSATACSRLRGAREPVVHLGSQCSGADRQRPAWFGDGHVSTPVYTLDELVPGVLLSGPAIVEAPFTTVVIDRPASFRCTESASLLLFPDGEPA